MLRGPDINILMDPENIDPGKKVSSLNSKFTSSISKSVPWDVSMTPSNSIKGTILIPPVESIFENKF